MAIKTGGLAALLTLDYKRLYVETGKERPLEYPLWCNVEDMEMQDEKDLQITGLSTMPAKDEGTAFATDEPLLGGNKTYHAYPYGMAIEFTWEMWRDELYGIGRELVAEMARASHNRQEVNAHDPLNNAFSTSFVGFTSGESLCSTSHTGLDGATRANRPSVDIGFSITGIQNAITRFEGMTNERGLPRLMAPVMAMVTPSDKFAAREILGSSNKPYTTDNEINALIEEDLSWMVNHFITTSTYWFLLAAKGVHDIWFRWRDHPMFDSFDDPWTKNAIFTSYQRHTVGGFGAWRGIDGSTG